jgi:hypothetical protein
MTPMSSVPLPSPMPVSLFAEARPGKDGSASGYVQFALETVRQFVAGNGHLPSLDFVMTHLRHTSLILGHERQSHAVFATVVTELRAEFPGLDKAPGLPLAARQRLSASLPPALAA